MLPKVNGFDGAEFKAPKVKAGFVSVVAASREPFTPEKLNSGGLLLLLVNLLGSSLDVSVIPKPNEGVAFDSLFVAVEVVFVFSPL